MIFLEALFFTATITFFATCTDEVTNGLEVNDNDPAYVTVTTFAGIPGSVGHVDGSATTAKFDGPRQLVLDTRSGTGFPNGALFVVDQGYQGLVIRAIDIVTGNVSTYVEKGLLYSIGDIILDTRVNEVGALLITDKRMAVVYQVRQDASGKGVLTKIAGGNGHGDSDGSLDVAQLSGPSGLAIDKAGMIYVFDDYFKTLKKIDVASNTMTKFAGRPYPLGEIQEPADGVGLNARLMPNVNDLTVSADGRTIYFAEWENCSLRSINIENAKVTTLISKKVSGYQTGVISDVAVFYPDLVVASGNNIVFYTAIGLGNGRGSAIFMADFSKQHVYAVVNGRGQGLKDGNGNEALFNTISGMAVSPDGTTIYVSDLYNNVIRKVVRD